MEKTKYEKIKYEKIWKKQEYRMFSPGLQAAPVFCRFVWYLMSVEL